MSCFDALNRMLGQEVALYTPARTVSTTKGVKDPTYTLAYTITGIVEELTASDEMVLAGGAVPTHAATLSVSFTDRAKLVTGNLIKDENGRIWKMAGVPVLYRYPLAHAEITLEYQPNPPTGL